MCISHTHSDNYFPGHKSFKEECHRIVISGVQIGLNETNLINYIHLITSLWRLVLNELTQLSLSFPSQGKSTQEFKFKLFCLLVEPLYWNGPWSLLNTAHFACLLCLEISTNEQMSWIRCDWKRRHEKWNVFGNPWFTCIKLAIKTDNVIMNLALTKMPFSGWSNVMHVHQGMIFFF